MIKNSQKHTTILEIPIIVQIIGDPELVASKLFDAKKDQKTGKLIIPKSVLVTDDVECRLKELEYRDEVNAPQDVLIVFGTAGITSKSSVIANFLYEKLKNFQRINLIINKIKVKISYELIYDLLDEMRI